MLSSSPPTVVGLSGSATLFFRNNMFNFTLSGGRSGNMENTRIDVWRT
jgi:hypothetical protein